jgi:hypothetical protein
MLVSVPSAPGAVEKNWVKIDPPTDKPFDPGQSQTFVVNVAVPPKSQAGSYSFRLDTVLVAKPDEGDQSSPLTFSVAAVSPSTKPFPWWILVVALVVLIALGVVLWLVLAHKGSKSENASDQPPAASQTETVEVPDLTGHTPEQAQNALQTAGLKLDPNYGSLTAANSPDIGKVGKQSPSPGEKVAKDSPVKIFVANTLSVPPPPPANNCAYGPDTCVTGYVWREASPTDHVCVTAEVRGQTAADNAAAHARVDSRGGLYGPDTCLQGFVWRDAFPGDHVCVAVATRNLAAADNAAAQSRRACK